MNVTTQQNMKIFNLIPGFQDPFFLNFRSPEKRDRLQYPAFSLKS